MNKRHYLDYNSTAPLTLKVKESLINDSYAFANPSSQHSSGKNCNKELNRSRDFLFNFFGLNSNEFDLIFHSGATEGINTILNTSSENVLFYSSVDHPCVEAMAKKNPDNSFAFDVLDTGLFDIENVINQINKVDTAKKKILNYTFINNETGVVWPLELALKIKNDTGCFVHIDAVQMIGKTYDTKLLSELDAYTFSGHKFGALKGIGFSFIRKNFKLLPLIVGGGQQGSKRSGTINTHGIFSLVDALESYQLNERFLPELMSFKNEMIKVLSSCPKVEVINNDSLNTITFVHSTMRSDTMLIHFDLEGLDVSTGSACSSGSHEASQVLLAMNYEKRANQNIRISLGVENLADKEEVLLKLKTVISKFY